MVNSPKTGVKGQDLQIPRGILKYRASGSWREVIDLVTVHRLPRSWPEEEIMPAPAPPPAADIAAARLRNEREVLLRYVVKLLTPDLRNAEDIVQETLLQAWLRADELDWQDRPIRPWLFRTARNLTVDLWRKDRSVPLGDVADIIQDMASRDIADHVVDRHWLVLALRRLPQAHYEILIYVHLLGLGGAEVANALRIPRGTVKSRTHHAMRSLRRVLNPPEDECDERVVA
jgi:RNA polymerase sigma-70 factor, ECF subfamily